MVEDDDVIKVGDHVSKTLVNSWITLTSHLGVALHPCGVTDHSKRRVQMQIVLGGIVSLWTVMWWSEETKSNR